MMHGSNKFLILTGDAKTLVYHRRNLLERLAALGFEVVGGAAEDDGQAAAFLRSIGGRFEALPIRRTSLNPCDDVRFLLAVENWIRRERPDFFFSYAIKSVVYGSIAARKCHVPRRFALVPGLGYAFTTDGSVKQKVVHLLSSLFYRLALPCNDLVLLQNSDDERLLRTKRLLPSSTPSCVTFGSGVDLEAFPARIAQDKTVPVGFVLVSRMLESKGVNEFAAVARMARQENWPARFTLAGSPEDGPGGIGKDRLKSWHEEGILDYRGSVRDVAGLLREHDVFVLPSYYREGVPRSILEALSTGLPIVTCQGVGTRETVRDASGDLLTLTDESIQRGSNGYLVRPRDVAALASALGRFLSSPEEIDEMGAASRRLAESLFDVDRVNERILQAMRIHSPILSNPESKLVAAAA